MMKPYYLLRKNKESGPYTKDDLILMGLEPTDLIWIEGLSTSWYYATEIPALHIAIVPESPKAPIITSRPKPTLSHDRQIAAGSILPPVAPKFRERVRRTEKGPVFRKQRKRDHSFMQFAFVILFVFLGAAFLKTLVDGKTVNPMVSKALVKEVKFEEPPAPPVGESVAPTTPAVIRFVSDTTLK